MPCAQRRLRAASSLGSLQRPRASRRCSAQSSTRPCMSTCAASAARRSRPTSTCPPRAAPAFRSPMCLRATRSCCRLRSAGPKCSARTTSGGGVNAVDYSGYPDCRPEFIAAFESLANLATKAGVEGHRLRVQAPLIRLSKADIVREGVRLGVDFAATVVVLSRGCARPRMRRVRCVRASARGLRSRRYRRSDALRAGALSIASELSRDSYRRANQYSDGLFRTGVYQ